MSVVNNPLLSKPIGGILLSEQQQQHPEHHSKIKVGVRAFCGILEINDPEQFFENDFELYMHWEDPHLQVEDEAENGFIDLEKPPEWQPIVSVDKLLKILIFVLFEYRKFNSFQKCSYLVSQLHGTKRTLSS